MLAIRSFVDCALSSKIYQPFAIVGGAKTQPETKRRSFMEVVTTEDVLQGREIQHAERDGEGMFHFYSKAAFDARERRECKWEYLASIHPEISAFRDRPNGWEAHRGPKGW
jgi:hypothetical protein